MAVEVHVNSDVDVAGIGSPGNVVERAVRAALADAGVEQGELSVTLLDDGRMAEMNRQWKGRDGPTDVLAFALHGDGEPLLGDVYLGVERAVAQAREHEEPDTRELARLAVHGTLHVLGHDHPEEGRETSEMWQRQERIVAGIVLP